MKFRSRKMAAIIAAAVCLTCFSAAGYAEESTEETTEEITENKPISGSLENGSYIIRIPDADLGWLAYDMAQDDSVVTLGSEEHVDGDYVVRYDPAGDGAVTVGVRHFYNAFACDQVLTWDLKVEGGEIREVTGGSHSASPDKEFLDPYISGEWTAEDQPLQLTIAGGADRAWDVEAVYAAEENAYVFKTSIYYDCEQDAFAYDKGKYFNAPENDSEDEGLGEAFLFGTTGSFRFDGESEEDLKLVWWDGENPAGEEHIFVKMGEAETTEEETGEAS